MTNVLCPPVRNLHIALQWGRYEFSMTLFDFKYLILPCRPQKILESNFVRSVHQTFFPIGESPAVNLVKKSIEMLHQNVQ